MERSPRLQEAADQAGITIQQAQVFMRSMRSFTHGMANAGDVPIPPFSWPNHLVDEMQQLYAGWQNLTKGEYVGTRAAVIWRAVCDYLLADDVELWTWEQDVWKHPVQSEQAVQETAK